MYFAFYLTYHLTIYQKILITRTRLFTPNFLVQLEFELNFNIGNVAKYIARYKNKNGLEDLEKAKVYLSREIAKLEKIEISDEDANKEADKLAEMYQMSKEEVVNAFGGVDMIKYDQKMKRTIDFLKENN